MKTKEIRDTLQEYPWLFRQIQVLAGASTSKKPASALKQIVEQWARRHVHNITVTPLSLEVLEDGDSFYQQNVCDVAHSENSYGLYLVSAFARTNYGIVCEMEENPDGECVFINHFDTTNKRFIDGRLQSNPEDEERVGSWLNMHRKHYTVTAVVRFISAGIMSGASQVNITIFPVHDEPTEEQTLSPEVEEWLNTPVEEHIERWRSRVKP